MVKIHLRHCLKGPAVIVPHPTGVVYGNQVDGCACDQPELEGFLIPLYACRDGRTFDTDEWYCRLPGGSWNAAYDMLEYSLNSPGNLPPQFKILRDRKNVEAWIHVEFTWEDGNTYQGILTWENSD